MEYAQYRGRHREGRGALFFHNFTRRRMIRKIVFKQGRAGVGAKPRAVPQPFLYPEGRFGAEQPGEDGFWICVRTRPRWEKKFVVWMMERHRTCFLPVFPHETASGRKRRTSLLPLFPGFVFVEGDFSKKDFASTGCVAYVLRPRGVKEAEQLQRELRDVWKGLASGLYLSPVHTLATGERCRIVDGPLRGVEAKFERRGRQGRLVLQVEIMGGGVAVEVPANEVETEA